MQRNIPSRYIAAALFIPISFENFLKKRMCKRMSRENRVTWLPALERKALVLFSFFLFLDGLHVFYFTSVGSRITWFISSWEENNCYVKLSKFTKWQLFSFKMTLICSVVTTVILFSAWDKSRDPGANWRKLEHM